MQRQRGHIVAEDDLVRRGSVQEIRRGDVRLLQDLIRLLAGGEGALVIRIAVQQVALDAFQALPGDLRAAGVVEEHIAAMERGELFTDEVGVEGHAVLHDEKGGGTDSLRDASTRGILRPKKSQQCTRPGAYEPPSDARRSASANSSG